MRLTSHRQASSWTECVGRRIVQFGIRQKCPARSDSANQKDLSVFQKRSDLAASRRDHLSRRRDFAGGRVVQFGTVEIITVVATGNQNFTIWQEGCCVPGTSGVHIFRRSKSIGCRVKKFCALRTVLLTD